MAAKGQYCTEAQRVAIECTTFWVERIALLYTIIVAPWLEKPPCPEPQEQGMAACLVFSSHWYISLMMVSSITPAFCLCRWLYEIEESSWIERTLFLVERLLLLVSLALVPTESLWFFRSVILFNLSLLASGVYFACFLDRISYLHWIMGDSNDNDCHEIGKNVGISEEEDHDNGKNVGIIEKVKDHDNGKNVDISEEEEKDYDNDNDNGKNVDSSEKREKDNDNSKNVSVSKEEDRDKDEEKEEKEEVCLECWRNMKKEQCGGPCKKCCECELVLAKWELKFEKLQDKWLRMMEDTLIATKKKQQEAEDVYQKDRRKWEEEKVQLAGKLSAAIATAELYRSLLHDGVGTPLWE